MSTRSPLRAPRSLAKTPRFPQRRLWLELLEERCLLDNGQWLVHLFNLPGNTRDVQMAAALQRIHQAELDQPPAGLFPITVINHVGADGIVLIQTSPQATQAQLESELRVVQGFDYLEDYDEEEAPQDRRSWFQAYETPEEIPSDEDTNGPGGSGSGGGGGVVGPLGPGPLINLINGFNGMNSNQTSCNCQPPDTIGAAGPNSYIEALNTALAIYNKSNGNTLVAPTSFTTFFSSLGTTGIQFSDPVVAFDDIHQRFVVGILDFHTNAVGNPSDSRFDFAVSKSANPATLSAADWIFFRYNTNDGTGGFDFSDYPKLGYNADGYYVSFNMFPNLNFYDHSDVLAISAADPSVFNLNIVPGGFNNFTLAPATMHSSMPGDPEWFVMSGNQGGASSTTAVVRMANPLSAAPRWTTTNFTVASYAAPPRAAQQGGGQTIDTLDARFYFSAERTVNGVTHLVATNTVGTAGVARVRWYDFDIGGGTPSIIQQGEINPGAGVFTYLPSIDINAAGAIGLNYAQSSTTSFWSMYVTGRAPSDPLGTMQAPILAKAGVANSPDSRAGDYSFVSVDPTDGTFWAVNEYGSSNPFWSTWIAHFNVVTSNAPFVSGQSPTGTILPPLNSLQITFNKPVRTASNTLDGGSHNFTAAKVQLTGPGSPGTITVTPVNEDAATHTATTFTITFGAPVGAVGAYSITIGPDIADAAGNLMDQGQNGGNAAYTGTFTVASPAVVSSTPTGNQAPPVTKVHVTFNEPVLADPNLSGAFTVSKITSFTFNGSNALGDIASVTPTNSTDNGRSASQFDINFNGQGEVLAGNYSLVIGTGITDPFNNALASPFTAAFTIVVTPPAVTAFTPSGTNGPIQSQATVTFNVPVLVSSFGTAQIHIFTRNGSNIAGDITSVTPVNSSDGGRTATQFRISFASGLEKATGVYSLTLGPDITDQFGNRMAAAYTATFNIDGPKVTAVTPSSSSTPVTGETITFSRAMDATTFTTSQITITGPGGAAVAIGSLSPTTGSATTFTITFATPQTAGGTYTTIIGPNVQDTFGNAMDQNGNFIPGENPGDKFTGTWATFGTLGPDAFGYTASLTASQNLDIVGQQGTFTIIASGDDISVPLSLSTSTFNLYGKVYSTLYVSSNGIISLSNTDTRFNNVDLKTDTNEPIIAPLWDDWVKYSSPMVVGQFRDFVNGKPTHLVIEWYQIQHYPTSQPITFEVQLDLNSGVNTANILYNFQNINTNDSSANGQHATVGIKDSGNQSSTNNVLQVAFRQTTPFVGSNKAILFTAPAFGATVSGTVYNDLNHNGTRDSGESALSGWRVYQDVNNNGVLDATEPFADSDANGNYTLTGVFPGTVRLREVLQPGYARSQPGAPGTIVFTAGVRQSITGKDFGNYTVTALVTVDDDNSKNTVPGNSFTTSGNGWSTVTGSGYQGSYASHLAAAQPIAGPDGFTYRAVTAAFQNLELAGDPNAFTIISGGDDVAAPVDLGTHVFTFYGQQYTGNNQLFVSSNGLITFGSANTYAFPSDLTTTPNQFTIAALLNDWFTGPGTPMVLGEFDTANHRLIIEWNKVRHYPGTVGTGITFQAILSLDDKTMASDIVFNYVNLTGAPGYDEGSGPSTVGIKAVGFQGPFRLIVNSAGVNVASKHAIRITINPVSADTGTATWMVTPPSGSGSVFEVFATWVADASNATNATYKVYDGAVSAGKLLGSVVVDQTQAPSGALINNAFWDKLGKFTTTAGFFTIVLDSSTANGAISADAVFVAAAPTSISGPLVRSVAASSTTVGTSPPLDPIALLFNSSPTVTSADSTPAPSRASQAVLDRDALALEQLFGTNQQPVNLLNSNDLHRVLPSNGLIGDPLSDLLVEELLANLMKVD